MTCLLQGHTSSSFLQGSTNWRLSMQLYEPPESIHVQITTVIFLSYENYSQILPSLITAITLFLNFTHPVETLACGKNRTFLNSELLVLWGSSFRAQLRPCCYSSTSKTSGLSNSLFSISFYLKHLEWFLICAWSLEPKLLLVFGYLSICLYIYLLHMKWSCGVRSRSHFLGLLTFYTLLCPG